MPPGLPDPVVSIGLGSLILHTSRLQAVVAFYRELGIPLEHEAHESGPLHFACELGGVHIAVYEAEDNGLAPGDATRWLAGGGTWPGFATSDFDGTLARSMQSGTRVLSGPEERPWGLRVVLEDPDGRPVELWRPPDA